MKSAYYPPVFSFRSQGNSDVVLNAGQLLRFSAHVKNSFIKLFLLPYSVWTQSDCLLKNQNFPSYATNNPFRSWTTEVQSNLLRKPLKYSSNFLIPCSDKTSSFSSQEETLENTVFAFWIKTFLNTDSKVKKKGTVISGRNR